MHPLTKCNQTVRVFKSQTLHNVLPGFIPLGGHIVAKGLVQRRNIHSGFQRLAYGMGRIEQAHIQLTIHSQCGAHFPPQSGGGQSKGTLFYQIVAPGYVTAGAGHTAAGVFNQRPGDQICPHLGGLLLIDKFTVTVVYHHNAVGVLLFCNLCHLLRLL